VIIRGITKADYDFVVTVIDVWWGGLGGEKPHPIFFYELGQNALIAEEDGKVAGFLLGFVAPGEPNTGYVHLCGIAPEHRRHGVGKALYEKFVEKCRAEGVGRLKALTNVGNSGSVRFHEALGFVAREDPNYAGPGRARIVFTKEL